MAGSMALSSRTKAPERVVATVESTPTRPFLVLAAASAAAGFTTPMTGTPAVFSTSSRQFELTVPQATSMAFIARARRKRASLRAISMSSATLRPP